MYSLVFTDLDILPDLSGFLLEAVGSLLSVPDGAGEGELPPDPVLPHRP